MDSNLSEICVERCKGVCCDPWWAIISYGVVKRNGESGMDGFEAELVRGIRERAGRVVGSYVTSEKPARHLFTAPFRYNLIVSDIKADGPVIWLDLIAMFAFRCAFMSIKSKTCAIHPLVLGGADIRPGRCAKLGSLEARPGTEGYCRIIHAAQDGDAAVDEAVRMEKSVAQKHLKDGFDSPEGAATAVVKRLKDFCEKNAGRLAPEQKKAVAGRNDPCPCGSGRKHKRCCGG